MMESEYFQECSRREVAQINDTWIIHAKNARINSDIRLVALLTELQISSWDFIRFAEQDH